MRKLLELQADRIEQVFSLHKVPARVTGGTVTPRWVRFQVLPAVGAKISKIKNLSEELAAALDAPSCRVSRRGAAIAIEVPRDNPQPTRLLPLLHQLQQDTKPYPPITATLGLAEDGSPLLIHLPSPDVAHILVAGTTGSGKTVLLQGMILSLAMSNDPSDLSLVLIDPKGSAFRPFDKLPHLARPVIREMKETVEALQSLLRFMQRREQHEPHTIIVIDELVDLLMTGRKPIQWALTRLTQRGRSVGIHVIAATQKPTSAVIGTLVKANFPVRLVGRVMSVEDARVATGWSGSGAERLLGQGDFLAIAEGKVTRFQAAHITGREIRETVAKMPTAIPLSLSAQAGIPLNTPARIRAISPILTLPAPPPHVDYNLPLAQKLLASPLWDTRYTINDTTKYRWGWMTQVSLFLFNHQLEGTWDRKTRHILALAEQISSTTTTQKPPGEGPRGGPVELRE